MRDEARHVAFGVLSLQDLYTKEMSSTELREREEFVIEATVLMRDRLLMEEVWRAHRARSEGVDAVVADTRRSWSASARSCSRRSSPT